MWAYPTGSIRGTWNHPECHLRLCQRFQDDGNGVDVTTQVTPELQRRMRTGIWQVAAKRNRWSTASDLSRQLSSATGTTVSRQTVYRRLGHIGLYARRPVRCVLITATHCRLRFTWSRACIMDTTTVVLCDVFRRVQSVMMTGHIYRDVILEQHVRLFRGTMGAEFLFMDDNARSHRANIVDECLQSEDITRMD
ncbi:transposable element Tcb1 transposase [Trichonephila clavipes]|uniref:Transposable element Tcb1 transposase n=1 Tax=Trichonephila clavipes TaxID=2585209 RepID=A0A8X6SZY5_TRICX|nr:transposable element Tcb1 transposase [Trichonephila clavipes]